MVELRWDRYTLQAFPAIASSLVDLDVEGGRCYPPAPCTEFQPVCDYAGDDSSQNANPQPPSPLSLGRLREAFAAMLGSADRPQETGSHHGESGASATGESTPVADAPGSPPELCEISPRSVVEAMLFVGRPDNRPAIGTGACRRDARCQSGGSRRRRCGAQRALRRRRDALPDRSQPRRLPARAAGRVRTDARQVLWPGPRSQAFAGRDRSAVDRRVQPTGYGRCKSTSFAGRHAAERLRRWFAAACCGWSVRRIATVRHATGRPIGFCDFSAWRVCRLCPAARNWKKRDKLVDSNRLSAVSTGKHSTPFLVQRFVAQHCKTLWQ